MLKHTWKNCNISANHLVKITSWCGILIDEDYNFMAALHNDDGIIKIKKTNKNNSKQETCALFSG